MIISKNTKIFLAVFSIIIIIITIIAIMYTNKNKGTNESQIIIEGGGPAPNISAANSTTEVTDTTKGVSLEDTYSTNGLTYTYKETERNNINIHYPVIDGLKNESVLENVNDQILEKIYRVLDSNNFKNNSDDSAYVRANVSANFSDILSVKIFVQFTEDFSKYYGVNFRLDTGERIKIDELFTYNTPKKNIVSRFAYKTFALGYCTNEGFSNDFYSKIDSDVFTFLQDFNDGKVTEFSFTPMYIELYREGRTVRIEMKEYAEYIPIYNRFKSTSNLYKNSEKVVKDIPVFMQRRECLFDLYEKVGETCIIDVCIIKAEDEEDFSEKEMEVVRNYRRDLIARLGSAKQEKGMYYSNYVIVSRGREDEKDILIFNENEKYLKTREENFSKYYTDILNAERDIYNENHADSMIGIINKNERADNSFEVKYSLETGKEIVDEEPEENIDEQDGENNEENNREPEERNTPTPTPEPSNTATNEPTDSPSPTPTQEPTPSNTPPVNITTQVYF